MALALALRAGPPLGHGHPGPHVLGGLHDVHPRLAELPESAAGEAQRAGSSLSGMPRSLHGRERDRLAVRSRRSCRVGHHPCCSPLFRIDAVDQATAEARQSSGRSNAVSSPAAANVSGPMLQRHRLTTGALTARSRLACHPTSPGGGWFAPHRACGGRGSPAGACPHRNRGPTPAVRWRAGRGGSSARPAPRG